MRLINEIDYQISYFLDSVFRSYGIHLMRTFILKLVFLTSIITFNLFGSNSKNVYYLDDYVVTASRFPQVIGELSPSVSYISSEQLENSHWQSLSDVLLQMPGVFLVSNGGMGTVTSLFTRGSESNHTAILLNGRRLPSGFSGNYDIGQISLVNLSSVEMVRGDNSSLHGDGAIGGMINLRSATNRPGLNESFIAEGGSDDFARFKYSSAFANDRMNLTFSLDRSSTDGYRPKEFYDRKSGNLYFDYKVNEKLDLDFQYYFSDSELGVPGNANWWVWGISDEKNFTSTNLYSPQLSYQISDTDTLKLMYTYSETTLESLDGYSDGLFEEQVNSVDIIHQHSSPENFFHQLFGYSFDLRDYDRNQAGVGGASYRYKFKANALFSQSAFRMNANNTAKVGLRYTNYNHTYEDGWTGNFQFLHKPKSYEDLCLFIKASVGTSPPELSILKSDWEDILSEDYGLEKMRSFEIGFKKDLSSQGELGLIYFSNIIQNIADTQYVGYPNTSLNYSPVDTKQKGIEAYFQSAFKESFSYNLSYTYLDAIVEDSAEDGIYYDSAIGSQLIRRPVHKLILAMEWEVLPDASIGAQFMRAIDREDPSGTRFDDMSILRLYGNYDIDEQWRIFWRAENALDEDYEWTSGYQGTPRSYAIGTHFKF